MNVRTSFLTRCLALVLAVMLLVSGTNIGVVLQALARSDASVTEGQLVADNYDLTDAEKALLSSGNLVCGTYSYTVPGSEDGLISVDTDEKKITAQKYEDWIPTTAAIFVGNEEKETVVLTNGEGTYTYDGNAFSVQVGYSLSAEIDTDVQKTLLNAAGWLKQGVANTDAVAAQAGNLYILEQAMPELLELRDLKIETAIGSVSLSDDCKNAITALANQMENNNGQLLLSTMIEEYESGSKTAYLMTEGTAMQAEIKDLVNKVSLIADAMTTFKTNNGVLIQWGYITETVANQLETLAGVCNNLSNGLKAVNSDPWTAANMGTALVVENANYAALDTLVAALGDITAEPEIKETLNVASTTVKVNMAMYNVTVEVVLNTVDGEYGKKEVVLTLSENATADEILAEVRKSNVETEAIAAWGDAYVAEHYEKSAETLPDTLTEDITYKITYNPKNYTVTIAGEAAEYPYGYQLTLPKHSDAAQSYDYYIDNTYYAQGSVITVTGELTVTREVGKAYTSGRLLNIIAGNYVTDNDKVSQILTSGALNVDKVINYREPTLGELETLVVLDEDNKLTVGSYKSDYAGLYWTPYSYVVDGTEKLFNGATEVTIDSEATTVNVYYRLTLSNYSQADVGEIFALVETLADEADGQTRVMKNLAANESQMGQLTKNMLNGLNGVIGGYSSANGGGLHDDPATNDELVAYFQNTIGAIIKNCVDSNNYLKLYNIIVAYNDPNNGGLIYYYQNDETVRNEVKILSDYLNDMLDDGVRQEALEKLMEENGYSQYVATLETLGDKLARVSEELKPVNSAIDTSDPAKLSALAKALTMAGSVKVAEYDSPYVQMGPVVRTPVKYATVEITVTANGIKNTDPITVTVEKGEALTQAQVDALKNKVTSFVNSQIDTAYFNNNFSNGAALDELVGAPLDANKSYSYEWTAKEYTVKINGENDQTVTVNSLTITLPAHPQAGSGMSYEYTIGEQTANAGIFTFTKDQLNSLFVNGTLTITRTEKNAAVEKLVKMVNSVNTKMGFEALTLVQENGVYTGITANMGMDDMMDFVMALVLKSGYGHIGLNNEGLVYENDNAELEISLQTLVNAVLADEDFSNDTIISLGENGKGKLVTASMQLGSDAENLEYTNLTFQMNLSSVPAQLTSNVDTIKSVSNYIKFYSNNGELAVEVTLPDQVYGAYAAVLIASGVVDKTDVNALEQAVAVQFVYDYFTAITGSDMDMETFTNTLKMLGVSKDLTAYNNYYNSAINVYKKCVTVAISNDGTAIDMSAPGKTAIDALIKFTGNDASSLSNYLNMIKEYKGENTIDVSVNATLENTGKSYKALIVDAQASGVANKFGAPSSDKALATKTASLAGYSAVMLLDDVTGDLTVSGTTILDLNGKNVEGTINATGTLYIIDSGMDTYGAGTVKNVTGNAVILGGNYENPVTSYLKDGYYMDGTTVRNSLYYISDKNGTVNFIINGEFYNDENTDSYIPNVKALAIDIAADLVLNYALSANLSVEGYELIDLDINDLVGLYADESRVETAVKTLIGCVTVGEEGYDNNVGFEGVVNMILADLIDFASITDALVTDSALATYEVSTEPWKIDITHENEGNDDYVTVDVTSNPELKKTFNVALTIDGENDGILSNLTEELSKIVVKDETTVVVDIPAPAYSNKELTVTGAGKAIAVVDMSENNDYATMIGVILAYGNADKRTAVADAINNGDMAALKAVVDGTSVKEVFTALKAMSRNVDFAAMAKKVGVTIDTASAAALEADYHLYLCAAGAALEKADITGMSSKLGSLYNDETGYYELTKGDIFRDVERTVRGYTGRVELTADELTLKVKLFADEEPCMIGDVNHNNEINLIDAGLIQEYLAEMDPAEFCFRGANVDGDDEITVIDAGLMREYLAELIDEFPAENN